MAAGGRTRFKTAGDEAALHIERGYPDGRVTACPTCSLLVRTLTERATASGMRTEEIYGRIL
jgi:hypothetical protein